MHFFFKKWGLYVALVDRNIFCRVETLFNTPLRSTHRLFNPTETGPRHCYACVGPDEATCRVDQYKEMCATTHYSLGTTHCGSAVVKYQDKSGKVLDGFVRGCVQCAGTEKFKKAAKFLNSLT